MTPRLSDKPLSLHVDIVVSPAQAVDGLALRIRRSCNAGIVVVFVLLLAVVLFGTCWREQPPLDENRERHPLPPLGWKRHELQDCPRWFDLYLGDRVGYRDVMLKSNHALSNRLFHESASELGWIGQDGWLYLNVSDPHRGRDDLPGVPDRIAVWAEALADRAAFLRARQIQYVVLIAPEKSSIYPEHLTEKQSRSLPVPNPTKLLVAELRQRGIRCVDPTEALLAAKSQRLLYHELDTHWNHDGAKVAHDALLKEIGVNPLSLVQYTVHIGLHTGDLGRAVGQPEAERQRPARFYTGPRAITIDRNPGFAEQLPASCKPKNHPPRVFTCAAARGQNVVFHHDSFGEVQLGFLTTDFPRVATVASDGLEPPMILAEQPDVVVQELVERKFYRLLPTNPPEVTGASRTILKSQITP